MSGKQLDFFGRLAAALRPPPALPVPTETPAETPNELQCTARELLQGLGYAELAARVQVRWNPRMRSTAGAAYPHRAQILLNPRLQEFGEAEIDRTLRHELAHVLAQHRAGRKKIAAHGEEWQRACRDLGLVNEARCHTLPLPRRKLTRNLKYQCPACAAVIHRVRPIKRKSACLACCRAHNGGRYSERFRLKQVAS